MRLGKGLEGLGIAKVRLGKGLEGLGIAKVRVEIWVVAVSLKKTNAKWAEDETTVDVYTHSRVTPSLCPVSLHITSRSLRPPS